jgi:two-component system LytT family response regulator
MTTVIVEDEPHNINVLRSILSSHCPQVQVVGQAGSVAEAKELVLRLQPQLLFLDVRLTDGSAFDLLSQIDYSSLAVIFTTAHEEHALSAFKFSAVDYLMKPLSISEVQEAVQRAQQKMKEANPFESLKQMLNEMQQKQPERLALPTLDGLQVVDPDDIIYIEAAGSYCLFHLAGKEKIMVSRTLKHFEEALLPRGFFRIHHSHIIQLKHVMKYVKGSGGYVVMQNGATLDVSSRRKDEFVKKLTSSS